MNGLSHDPRLLDDLLTWQESTFFADPSTAGKFIPLFTQQFLAKPSTLGPLRSLAGNLFSAVAGYDATRVSRLKSLTMPVHIIWGAKDPDLGLNVADALQQEIPQSTLTVFPNAHHNLMLDDPTRVRGIRQIHGNRMNASASQTAQRTDPSIHRSGARTLHTDRLQGGGNRED